MICLTKEILGVMFLLEIVKSNPKTDDPNYTACNETNITWGVDYTGGSSKFNFYECSNKQNSMTTTMVELAEYDNQKRLNSNKIVSFASQNWIWSTQEYDNYTAYNNQSVEAVCNTYNSTLSFHGNGASNVPIIFEFTSCLMLEDFNYEVCPDETVENPNPQCYFVSGTSSSLKWSVKIGSFPFSSSTDTLQLTIELQQTNAGSNFAENTTDPNLYQAIIGNFSLVAPLSGKVTDDQGQRKTVGVDVSCIDKGNNKVDCTFTFGYYVGTLDYDPTVSGNVFGSSSSTSNNGNSGSNSSNASILSLFNVYSMICFFVISVLF